MFAVTLLATLFFGVQWGLLTGAVAGLAAFLWFSSLPRVTRVGSLDDDHVFRFVVRSGGGVVGLRLVLRVGRSGEGSQRDGKGGCAGGGGKLATNSHSQFFSRSVRPPVLRGIGPCNPHRSVTCLSW